MNAVAVCLLLMSGAVAFLLAPLLRKSKNVVAPVAPEMGIYTDQLRELDADILGGRVSADEAEAARTEIYKRALNAEKVATLPVSNKAGTRTNLWVAVIILLVVPMGSGIMYFHLGVPELPAKPYAARLHDPEFIMAVETQKLAEALDKMPTAKGFAKLGDAYSILRRFDLSIEAYEKALSLDPRDANLWSELGEAMGLANRGVIDADARAAFSKSLRLDPHMARSRYYLGVAALQEGKPQKAVAVWRDLENDSAKDAEWLPLVKKSIEAVSQKAGFDPATIEPAAPQLSPPDAADTILSMSAKDQNAAIRSMVDRLAERLKQNPDDLEGWKKLAKSYTVLGEVEKAKSAEKKVEELRAKVLAP